MNNNNLYNTNNFIGITHNDIFKISSNALLNQIYNTSNILESHLSNTSNILEQHLSNTSNILDSKASNFTTTTSNLILARYDPMIREEIEEIAILPIGAIETSHTYIQNINVLGEIRFLCKYASNFPPYFAELPEYRVRIAPSGKLFCYYTYDPLINATYLSGWVDVINSIVGLNADSFNQGVLITGLEAQILNLKTITSDQFLSLITNLEDDYIITSGARTRIQNELQNISLTSGEGATRTSMLSAYNNFRAFINTGRISRLNTALEIINFRISQNAAAGFFLGVGGAVFGLLYNLIQSQKHNDFMSIAVSEKIESNLSLTTDQKRNLHQSNLDDMSSNMIDQLEYMYNISVNQGFINYNIQTQQYIKDLKCDNLNLNTGNISGINYINVNNIVADGRIKENNKFLDTTYLTSNHIYNLAYNYTAERQYPSKLYNIIQPEDTTTLLGKLVYRSILYLNNQSISYGSGYYEVYSSSSYDTNTTKDKLFNFNTSETTTSARWGISLYNSGTGNYQGDNSIDGNFGDWVIIKLPQPILLTRYRIYQRSDFLTKAPSLWKVYGSNDGITFTEITEANQTTRLTSYSGGFFEKTLNASFTTLYSYIGFVFGSLLSTSGQTDLSFAELQLFGKEILNNTIVSNIYTTSNAVKSIVENEMPVVKKHRKFTCVVSTPIGINSITFYKYDIDLRKYISKGFLNYTNDPYRIFNIQVFYSTSYFSTMINNLPDIIDTDIFMCYRANPSQFGVAGLNIYSYGNTNNPNLRSIPPNNLFLMDNGIGSIDYITIVSRRVADVSVIISDMIG